MKYAEPKNKNWFGAHFFRDESLEGKYKKTARCKFCNKFFNWRQLIMDTQEKYPEKTYDHYFCCPHCNQKVYD